MKNIFSGSGKDSNWYGLRLNINLNHNYTIIIETVSWEVWKLTIIRPDGFANEKILRKKGNEKPYLRVHKRLINRLHSKYEYTIGGVGLNIEECEKE